MSILKIKDENGVFINIPAIKGSSGVYIGDVEPIEEDVWIDTSEEPDELATIEYVNGKISEQNILWQGGAYPVAVRYEFSDTVSNQKHGIILVWSRYDNETSTPTDAQFHFDFIPKKQIELFPGFNYTFHMGDLYSGVYGNKVLYFNDTGFTGHADNTKTGTGTTGITYNNREYCLRYVIGV